MRTRLLSSLLLASLAVAAACNGNDTNPGPCNSPSCNVPDAGAPDAGEPDAGEPDAGEPDAGEPDAGEPDAGEPDAGEPLPIEAAEDTWTWVEFPDSACGNGAPTGIGINPTTASSDVFIYLEGGGACWDELTCFTIGAAANLSTGYGETQFLATNGPTTRFMVQRDAEGNPFKDMSFVYVPYCTGDVHAGTAVQTYGSRQVHHVGAKNMDAYLARLAVTFPNAAHIFLAGSSAGGYGAQLNYERVAQAFPTAEVHLLADSGQMITPNGTLLSTWLANWQLSIPDTCTDCTTDFTKFPAWLADNHPDRRFALTAFTQDGTLRSFFGYSGDAAGFQTRTLNLLSSSYGERANAHYFLKTGTSHTMLGGLATISSTNGVTLRDWVSAWVSGDAEWTNESEVEVP